MPSPIKQTKKEIYISTAIRIISNFAFSVKRQASK